MSDQLTAGFSQKGFTKNFLELMKQLEDFKRCCTSFLTQIYTANSTTISFSGLGTKQSPLSAQVTDEVGIPSGPNESVQFNNNGLFGGSDNFTWNNTSQIAIVLGSVVVSDVANAPYSDLNVIRNGLGTSPADNIGLSLANNTASTAGGNSQSSPILRFAGSSWNTVDVDSIPASWTFGITSGDSSQSGISNSSLVISFSNDNGVSYNSLMNFDTENQVNITGQLFVSVSVNSLQGFGTNTFNLIPTGDYGLAELWFGDAPTGFRILNFENGSLPVNSEYMDMGWLNETNVFTINPGGSGSGVATRPLAINTNTTIGALTASTTSYLGIAASTSALAHINLAVGVAPASPANGDVWFDGTNIYMRVGGVTKTFTMV